MCNVTSLSKSDDEAFLCIKEVFSSLDVSCNYLFVSANTGFGTLHQPGSCSDRRHYPFFTRLVLLVQSCFNDLYFRLSLCIDASNFVALPVTWSGLFRLKISLFIFSLKVFSICSNTSLLADFFSANFFGEIAKLFFRSARTSVNNSDLFSDHRLAFSVVLPFWKPVNLLA